MNIQGLRYLRALEQHRSFSRAAEACAVSQPTLSAQIRKLEAELGVQLFERDGRRLRATPVGEAIVAQAAIALAAAERIEELARAHADPLVGSLRVGLIPTLAPYLLSSLLSGARERLPEAPLVVSEEITPHLIAQLLDGRLDAAIVATDHRDEGLSEIPLFDEPFHLAVAPNDRLARRERVSLAEVDEHALMLLVDGHCLRDQAIAMCSDASRSRVLASEVRGTRIETLLNLVAAGHGCTIVPALALDGARAFGVRTVELSERGASRSVRLVHRPFAARRAALAALAQVVRERVPQARVRVTA